MTQLKIFEVLKETIQEVSDYDVENISPETEIEALDLASLDFVSIQVACKRQLGVNVDLDELPKLKLTTIQDLINYVEALPQQALAS